jgi:uncharacterized membrane protein YciS (DUF1049 family)
MNIKLVLVLVLTGLAVAFMAQNAQVAELRFLVWTLAMSQALLLFLVLAIGVITGWVLHAWFSHQRRQRRTHAEAISKARER